MEVIEFSVPAIPIAQPRPRACRRGGHASVYEAEKGHPIHAFKLAARLVARMALRGRKPLVGPVGVSLQFLMPRPKSRVWKTKPMPWEWHASKPDVDNLAKAILDALNGILWLDDGQVCHLVVAKRISSGNEKPCVNVSVTELERRKHG